MTTQQPIIKLHDGNLMPQLGLGVWQASIEETTRAVSKALEIGYRSIDTAAIYKNEAGVGAALQSSSLPRSELFITTKLWNDDQGDPLAALETSLEKLRLDYVDLYLIHWPRPQQDQYVSAWRELIKLRDQGLVKSIGVCNFHTPHLQRLLDETNVAPVINQIELHPLLHSASCAPGTPRTTSRPNPGARWRRAVKGVRPAADQGAGREIRENPGADRGALAPGQRPYRDPEIGHAVAHPRKLRGV